MSFKNNRKSRGTRKRNTRKRNTRKRNTRKRNTRRRMKGGSTRPLAGISEESGGGESLDFDLPEKLSEQELLDSLESLHCSEVLRKISQLEEKIQTIDDIVHDDNDDNDEIKTEILKKYPDDPYKAMVSLNIYNCNIAYQKIEKLRSLI